MSLINRRSFLRGSAYFAAALALAATVQAQEAPRQDPPKEPQKKEPPKEEERRRGPKTDEEILAEQEEKRKVLYDDDGREYQICPQCGSHMYKQGRTWTCTNCGYTFVE